MAAQRPWLLPLVPLYAAGVAWRTRFPGRPQQLADPVVSVGSLSAGGAGKTPFVIALGEALRRAGYGIDVLSRGHGRTSTLNLRVHPEGSADEFGDEPLLLARRLLCPVYVARKRWQAGDMAERDRRLLRADRQLSMHLLDDGFQHRQLARAVDVALLTLEDAEDCLLPAGNLREPLRALRRADVIVLRSDEAEALRPVLRSVLGAGSQAKVWTVQRRSALVEGATTSRTFAFCGLARPAGFQASVAGLGIAAAGFRSLRDHQPYDTALVASLAQEATRAGADGFITTAKDAVKLTPALRRQLQQVGPLAVCDVAVAFDDETGCVRDVLHLIEQGWRKRLET